MVMMEKWKKAVVHLECACDSESIMEKINRLDELEKKYRENKITPEQYGQAVLEKSRDNRYHGTALFIIHSGKRYLLTARHVIWDEISAKRELEEEVSRSSRRPEFQKKLIIHSANESAQNRIFNIIFRVPSFDEIIKTDGNNYNREFLMNLGAGTPWSVPYTFTKPDLDLAIISLDQIKGTSDSRFADNLQELGYVPISSEEISDGPSKEGTDVFTVGFPESTSVINQINQTPASANWSSSCFSLPVFSFGKISMLHDKLPFYWVDMSIYPGNSGGPVVENNKLIGIINAQATIPIDAVPNIATRIPFGKIIKTKYVHELLRIQEEKDSENSGMTMPSPKQSNP